MLIVLVVGIAAVGLLAALSPRVESDSHALYPIPAHRLTAATPVPFSPEIVRVTSDWIVSDGRTLVAVYAGEAGEAGEAGDAA